MTKARTVLIIDDNEDMRTLVAAMLAQRGYTVHGVEDGVQGVRMASAGAVDLILLDVRLAGADGIAVLRELRRSGFRKPVVLVTAMADDEHQAAGYAAGADGYLTKPFLRATLVRIVDQLLDTRSAPRVPSRGARVCPS